MQLGDRRLYRGRNVRLAVSFLLWLDLVFDREAGGNRFLRNVSELLSDYGSNCGDYVNSSNGMEITQMGGGKG